MLSRQRLIVRRTRLIGAQAELWPDWRHFAFLTNRTDANSAASNLLGAIAKVSRVAHGPRQGCTANKYDARPAELSHG
jgi:hypothetical protein